MTTTADKPWPSPRIVYARQYNIGFAGLERLHPFDSRKYGRAWEEFRRRFGRRPREGARQRRVLERDRFVLEQLITRRLPTLVVLSGGYSRESYRLVAAMVAHVVERWGGAG